MSGRCHHGAAKLVLVRIACLTGFFALLLCAAPASLHDKLNLIQNGRQPAGSQVVLTAPELLRWLAEDQAYWAAYGATNIRFTLASGRATAFADIDFLKARKAATGEDAGWIARNLFSGRKPVAVTARFSSLAGRARVDVERVEVNGIPVEGPALNYLVQDIVRPNFPDAHVSEWFPMLYRIDHFTVASSGVTIYIGK